MTTILLEPHHDDAVLFASYTLLGLDDPLVVTVLGRAEVQKRYGITGAQRTIENEFAIKELGVRAPWEWGVSDENPDWEGVKRRARAADEIHSPSCVWVPAWEEGGHEQHNLVNQIAVETFNERCRFYHTYKRGSARTRSTHEVARLPDWPGQKFRAMSWFQSQINLDNTRPWFNDWDREWVAQ